MKKIRLGIFGMGIRGQSLAASFLMLDCELVAVCDFREEMRAEAVKSYGKSVAIYDNFDEFIEHPMDAVILANNFYQHTSYTLRCFEKNLHVFCECISNGTMGEGVELARAFEKSSGAPVWRALPGGCFPHSRRSPAKPVLANRCRNPCGCSRPLW